MTNGFGAMPDYRAQVAPEDRWAIAAYIRALQLSQRATMADVPADRVSELNAPQRPTTGAGGWRFGRCSRAGPTEHSGSRADAGPSDIDTDG